MRKSTFIIWIYYRFYGEINRTFKENNSNKLLLNLYLKVKQLSNIDNRCTHTNPETDIASSFYCIMGLGVLYGLRAENILLKLKSLCEEELLKTGNDIEKNFSNYFLIHLKNK